MLEPLEEVGSILEVVVTLDVVEDCVIVVVGKISGVVVGDRVVGNVELAKVLILVEGGVEAAADVVKL